MSGCPFSSQNPDVSPSRLLPTGKARIKLLYEEYVHLPQLQSIWNAPSTPDPILEPCFAAGMHGIELCFLLLSEFIADTRSYVAKRPRIERVVADIVKQCSLLTEVIDGELEEEDTATNRLSLTQSFPFPGAPPSKSHPSHSPGLARLLAAIQDSFPSLTQAEGNSLIKVVINLSMAFENFNRWSVGLGIEPQLNQLREAVGLPALASFAPTRAYYLDYDTLVHPEVCEQTLTHENYTYHEDFFFRTVHLGTECWAQLALARLSSALSHAEEGKWHVAAARINQGARILEYLGEHVMLLTTMNLRDYLFLKVELEGTSGEGSVQVRAFRPTVKKLLDPLGRVATEIYLEKKENNEVDRKSVSANTSSTSLGSFVGTQSTSTTTPNEGTDHLLAHSLMQVYEHPDRPGHRELYNYCKALEDIESALLGGFYFKHYLLAQNVIGSDAKGTMKRAVKALKSTYETTVFDILDKVRTCLGAKVDAELAHVKGRMMKEIVDGYLRGESGTFKKVNLTASATATGTGIVVAPSPAASEKSAGGCPFSSNKEREFVATEEQRRAPEKTSPSALQHLYSAAGSLITHEAIQTRLDSYKTSLKLPNTSIPFLDHAWGVCPPRALHAALTDVAALYELGNPSWNILFGDIIPHATKNVKKLLHIPDTAHVNVHWGHNSHELVARLLSEKLWSFRQRSSSLPQSQSLLGKMGGRFMTKTAALDQNGPEIFRVLTTDCEFYSITRQLNRLLEENNPDAIRPFISVEAVPTEPAESFQERLVDRLKASLKSHSRPFDLVYVSQVTYLKQQTLVPDVNAFADEFWHIVQKYDPNTPDFASPTTPLLIIDGYHAFMAYPTSISETTAQRCCYLAGLLKHAGCGANAAFITTPTSLKPRPALTGWLADPSVLSPGSKGIAIHDGVGYEPNVALMGGTPGLFLPLLTFNHLMKMWDDNEHGKISVEVVHEHVLGLQKMLVNRLPLTGPGITQQRLVTMADEVDIRSHTLVFQQESEEEAKNVVDRAEEGGVLIDCRKRCVRVGFGPYHGVEDVEKLLKAVGVDTQKD